MIRPQTKHRRLFMAGPTALLIFIAGVASATIMGPYTPDVDTLHLWHMNEQTVPVFDLGSDGLHLTALRNGATLGNASYKGFGTALSTYDGGPDAITDAGKDAYLSARPLVDGPSDNVAMTYEGASGAFTYEALVRIDFDPGVAYGTNADGTVPGNFMQIINLDADESSNRICQLRLDPVGTLKGNSSPLLEFINLNKDKKDQIQSITVKIPISGPDAINMGNWYHVAVTFSGTPSEPDNFKFYWTLMDPSRSVANLIGTAQMIHSLPGGCSPDFAIGQTGRQSPVTLHPNQNFVGLIDEVRMSAVARTASQMMFGGPTILAKITPTSAGPAHPSAAPAQVEASSEPKSAASNGIIWVISGALLIMVGILGWLAFVIKRFITRVPLALASEKNSATGSQAGSPPEPPANNTESAGHSIAIKGAALTPQAPGASADNHPGSHAAHEPQNEAGFRGVLRTVGLQDLIQMECLNKKSCILEIKNKDLHGRMYLEQGEIIHAVAGALEGEQAFNKLLSLAGGEFSIKGYEAPQQRTIQGSWMQLLMEASQKNDEEFVQTANKKKPFFVHSGTTTEDFMAMATMLKDHPDVKEIVVCSKEGKTLYSSKCRDIVGREQVCSNLSRVAKTASELLSLGKLENVEILRADSKTVVQLGENSHLLVQMENSMPNVL